MLIMHVLFIIMLLCIFSKYVLVGTYYFFRTIKYILCGMITIGVVYCVIMSIITMISL